MKLHPSRHLSLGLWFGLVWLGQSSRLDAQELAPAEQAGALETKSGQPDADADVTQTIGGPLQVADDPQRQRASAGGETPAPGSEPVRSSLTGWFRESFEYYPYERGLAGGEAPDGFAVPRDQLLSRTQLLLRASYQRGRWFEATVSGALGLGVHVEGSSLEPRLWELKAERTSVLFEGRLMELYLGFFSRSFDLRLGQQRVAWGVADVLSPNDVVNARDLRDPFLAEPELTRIPTPMVRMAWDAGPLLLELLASPVFVPDRASLYGRNWSALQPGAPAAYRGLFAVLGRASDPSVRDQLNDALYQTRLPNRDGQGISAGGKLGLRLHGFDANLYYHYGYDGTPQLELHPAFAAALEATDFSRAGLSELGPLLRAIDAGLTPLRAEYVRRHHAGFDAVTALGPFMLRLDAAYQSQRVFYRSDLAGFVTPAVLGVVSLDYQTGSVDHVLLIEGVYIRLLDDPGTALLSYARDSYGVAGVTRMPLFSVFSLEIRVSVGISPRFFTAQPMLLAKHGGLTVRAGALLLDGDDSTLGGYYRNNATAFLQLRWGF